MKIIQMLKKARKKLGLSQRKFAKFLGVSKSVYNRYELGKRNPPTIIVYKCSKILEIKVHFRRIDDLRSFSKDKNKIVKKGKDICKKLDILRRIKMVHLKKLAYRSKLPYWKCCAIISGKQVPTRKEVAKITYAMNFSPSILRENNFENLLKKYSTFLKY